MATFETFTLLFKADSAQLKKEVDDVNKKTKELTDTSKASEDQTKKTDKEYESLVKTLAKLAATYFTVGSTISAFKSSVNDTTGLSQLAKETNVNIEVLDKFSRAVKNAGGDASSFHNGVLSLAESLNAPPSRVYDYILEEGGLADLFKKANDQNPVIASVFGRQYGFGPGEVAYLAQGGEKLRADTERQQELGVVTAAQAANVDAFNKSVGQLKDSFDTLKRSIVDQAIPGLIQLAELLTDAIGFVTVNQNAAGGVSSPAFEEVLHPYTLDLLRKHSYFFRRIEERERALNQEPEAIGNGTQVDLPNISNGYKLPVGANQLPHLPAVIAPMSNSQYRNLYMGDINVNSTAQDAKSIGTEVVAAIDQKSLFLNHLQQSNANFDNGIVV